MCSGVPCHLDRDCPMEDMLQCAPFSFHWDPGPISSMCVWRASRIIPSNSRTPAECLRTQIWDYLWMKTKYVFLINHNITVYSEKLDLGWDSQLGFFLLQAFLPGENDLQFLGESPFNCFIANYVLHGVDFTFKFLVFSLLRKLILDKEKVSPNLIWDRIF